MFVDRFITEYFCVLPGGKGSGGFETATALLKFAASIGLVEYRISYLFAVPTSPSSPGVVHISSMLVVVELLIVRSVISAGGVPSPAGGDVAFISVKSSISFSRFPLDITPAK